MYDIGAASECSYGATHVIYQLEVVHPNRMNYLQVFKDHAETI